MAKFKVLLLAILMVTVAQSVSSAAKDTSISTSMFTKERSLLVRNTARPLNHWKRETQTEGARKDVGGKTPAEFEPSNDDVRSEEVQTGKLKRWKRQTRGRECQHWKGRNRWRNVWCQQQKQFGPIRGPAIWFGRPFGPLGFGRNRRYDGKGRGRGGGHGYGRGGGIRIGVGGRG